MLNLNEKTRLEEKEMSSKKFGSICDSCGSTCVKINEDFNEAIPTQTIRIQDIGNFGVMSETVEILLEGKYAGKFFPGDKIVVTGAVTRKWKQIKKNEPLLSSITLKAIQIENQENDILDIDGFGAKLVEFSKKSTFEKRKFLLEIFASEIQGLSHIKIGLLICLSCGVTGFSGVDSTRSTCHILMVGDPGTGKSHLLLEASKLVSPSILMNGVGTSDAGLTSCAVRQGKEWSLEAGALVLSDMGICCIDEFNRLKVNEKSGLLEAMEQQTLSIAKAGIVTTLNTRCSIIAAASSKYNYNCKKTVSENLGISTPLVSRFDLIFGIFDIQNSLNDKLMAEKIFNRVPFLPKENLNKWNQSILRCYIGHCRKINNKISEKQADICLKYYMKKRSIDGNNEFNTIRMLESLVRIAEAHSKLMNLKEVSDEDIYIGIILMESGINSISALQINLEKVFFEKNYFEGIVKQLNEKYDLI